MLSQKLKDYSIILASKSPRRHFLLKESGIEFKVSDLHEVDETYPRGLSKYQIPVYLSELKSDAYSLPMATHEILITADTIVYLDGRVINKPADRKEAIHILTDLSGRTHEVITGVTIRNPMKRQSFFAQSEVSFSILKGEEIEYYIDTFRPYDKAGAYGIQEWIGYIGISAIKGSFHNVMGLPVQKLYRELEAFLG